MTDEELRVRAHTYAETWSEPLREDVILEALREVAGAAERDLHEERQRSSDYLETINTIRADNRRERDAAEARLADELRTHVAEWQAEATARATAEKERDLALVRAENAEARLAEAVGLLGDVVGSWMAGDRPGEARIDTALLMRIVELHGRLDARPSPAPTPTSREAFGMKLPEAVERACREPTLIAALCWIAIWENERAVRQALKGERGPDGQLWDTLFGLCFKEVFAKWAPAPTEPAPHYRCLLCQELVAWDDHLAHRCPQFRTPTEAPAPGTASVLCAICGREPPNHDYEAHGTEQKERAK